MYWAWLRKYSPDQPRDDRGQWVASEYWHGTSDERSGKAILASGTLVPQDKSKTAGMMKPVAGRVYLSPDPSYAQIYAIGGDVAGNDHRNFATEDFGDEGRYGYIFKVRGADLDPAKLIPDEDQLGNVSDFTGQYPPNEFSHEFSKALFANPSLRQRLDGEAQRLMTDRQYRQAKQGFMAYQAAGGKRMLKGMSRATLEAVMASGSNVAHDGPVKIAEAYRIDKTRIGDLKHRGADVLPALMRVAERVL